MKKKLLLNAILWISIFSSFQFLGENSVPEVKIVAPDSVGGFAWNTLVPFRISVNDKEDGNSEYDEINRNEVLLTVQYLNNSSKVKDYLAQNIENNQKILSWIGSSSCFTCHAAKEKLIGPSFSEISEKYGKNLKQTDGLVEKIKHGAKGVWGDQIMPAHPNLNPDNLKEAVEWILTTSSDPGFSFYAGTEGAFRTQKELTDQKGEGVYVLRAHYSDKGIDGTINTYKTGSDTVIIKCAN